VYLEANIAPGKVKIEEIHEVPVPDVQSEDFLRNLETLNGGLRRNTCKFAL